jgi:hypothetical protein
VLLKRDISKYTGEFSKGLKHGKGKLQFLSIKQQGSFYDGDWVNGKMEGSGKYMRPDGSTYSGAWIDGRMHGNGIEMKCNGVEVYDGSWKNGRRHGKGSLMTDKEGQLRKTTGEWIDGKYEQKARK